MHYLCIPFSVRILPEQSFVDILLPAPRSTSRSRSSDEYTAAIEHQASNWRQLATQSSLDLAATQSELDDCRNSSAAELKAQRTKTAEALQLLQSVSIRAAHFQESGAEFEVELTRCQALLRESDQEIKLLNTQLLSQVPVFSGNPLLTLPMFCSLFYPP